MGLMEDRRVLGHAWSKCLLEGTGGCLCSLGNPAPAMRVRTIIHSAGGLGVRVSISFPGPFPTRPLLYRACARHPRRRPFSWGSCWAPWVRQHQQESQNPDLTTRSLT